MTMFEKHPLRWGFHLLLGVVLAVFLLASIFCSVRASTDPNYCAEGGGIEDRLGILVVQVCHVQEDKNGILHDQLGYTYSGDGDGWIVFVYNPFSTYFDDVIARWDL